MELVGASVLTWLMLIAEFDKSSRNAGLRAQGLLFRGGFPLGSTRLVLPWTKSECSNGSVTSVRPVSLWVSALSTVEWVH